MRAELSLRGRREDGFRELFGLAQAGGELDAADFARRLVVLPAAADDVAARNALDENRLQALRNHGAAGNLRNFLGLHDRFRGNAREVIGDHVLQLLEPEVRERRKNLALAGNRIAEDHVKGGNAVRGDKQKLVVAHGVAVADLAAVNLLEGRDVRLGKTGH